jgi:hypothetical protein
VAAGVAAELVAFAAALFAGLEHPANATTPIARLTTTPRIAPLPMLCSTCATDYPVKLT